MDFKSFVFYLFSAIMAYASLRVITARNPVHAVLFLVLAFVSGGGIWMLLDAEFLAITLVLVYVGAVMVLFLFVVMMLDINLDRLREGFWSYLPLGATVGALMALEMGVVIGGSYFDLFESSMPAVVGESNVREIGRLIYTDYVYPFEVASVILLVAIVAAIALTGRSRKESKAIDPATQVVVRAADRVRLVSMQSEKKE
jgi:NADH-quinone oxidoreductase subunit J